MSEIKTEALRKLPPGKFLGMETVKDMDGKEVPAIKWSWFDPTIFQWQVGFFSKENGEYICHEID